MDRARIKTFILLLLLAVNLVFLTILVVDWTNAARRSAEARADLITSLDRMGITLRDSAIPAETPQQMLFVERDLQEAYNGEPTSPVSPGLHTSDQFLEDWGTLRRYDAGPQLDVTTALIALAGYVQEDGAITLFTRVEMGYYLLEHPGYLELRPVWIVETDGGVFSIDRQSGEIRR